MKKILFYWSKLKSTFWFIPFLLILLAILVALIAVSIDINIEFLNKGIGKYIFISSPNSARSVLSTISGAMIGVAGTVFSITLVVLTLASSQLGPRLISNFMYDRLNQIVLGSYVASFIYCLIVLNAIKEGGEQVFIPSLSITLAILAALANIFLLIIYIHHTAVSIQADNVISKVSAVISSNISQLFPKTSGNEIHDDKDTDVARIMVKYQFQKNLVSETQGYLQYVDHDALLKLAKKINGVLEIKNKPGEFIIKGSKVVKLFALEDPGEDIHQKVYSNLITGKTRTQQQDAEYTIHQVVEIASRALSPGVNDPFTAIACIDNLTSTLAYLTKVKFPSKYIFDEEENLRIISEVLTFEGMLDAAYNQIRQFATGSPSVLIRLMEALGELNEIAVRSKQKQGIKKHAEMVMNAGKQHFYEERDLSDLELRYNEIIK